MNLTIPLYPDMKTGSCETCWGLGTTMLYHVHEGPFQAPSRRGDKPLDLTDLGHGRGWFHGHLEVEPCPDCRKYAKRDYLIKRCGLEGDELDIRLSDFKTGGHLRAKGDAKLVMQKTVGQGRPYKGFITLWGEPGVGKTMLMKALANEILQEAEEVRYTSLADLIADIRRNFDEKEHRTIAVERAIQKWQTIPVLMIDELDKTNFTDWAKESLQRLINARYNNRKGRLTVMATNLNPEHLPAEFGYIYSRMRAGIIVHVPGPDVRSVEGKKAREELGVLV